MVWTLEGGVVARYLFSCGVDLDIRWSTRRPKYELGTIIDQVDGGADPQLVMVIMMPSL